MLTNLVKYKQVEVLRKEGNSYVLISTKLGILNSDLRIGLFIYDDIDNEEIIKFWSGILKIPEQ